MPRTQNVALLCGSTLSENNMDSTAPNFIPAPFSIGQQHTNASNYNIRQPLNFKRNGNFQKVTPISVEVDEDNMAPYYDIRLQNSFSVSVTKELLTHQDEKRIYYIPITAEKIQE